MIDRRDELTRTVHQLRGWALNIQRELDANMSTPIRNSFIDLVTRFNDATQLIARELRQTKTELGDTRTDLENTVRLAVEALADRTRELTRKLDEEEKDRKKSFEEQRLFLTQNLECLRHEMASLTKEVESTQRQCDLVDRRIRLIRAPGMKAEIDAWAVSQAELGVLVAEGRKASHRMHGMTGTEELVARIKKYDDDVAAHEHRQHEAVTAARELATLDLAASGKKWGEPLERWTRNHAATLALAEQLASSVAAARQAQEELDLASQRGADLQLVVDRGAVAEAALRQNTYSYLYSVLDAGQVLPIWLDLALGCGIPRQNWQEWLDTAVRVIMYRIVYRVLPGCDALGVRPAVEGRQRDEYDQLRTDCTAYRL